MRQQELFRRTGMPNSSTTPCKGRFLECCSRNVSLRARETWLFRDFLVADNKLPRTRWLRDKFAFRFLPAFGFPQSQTWQSPVRTLQARIHRASSWLEAIALCVPLSGGQAESRQPDAWLFQNQLCERTNATPAQSQRVLLAVLLSEVAVASTSCSYSIKSATQRHEKTKRKLFVLVTSAPLY